MSDVNVSESVSDKKAVSKPKAKAKAAPKAAKAVVKAAGKPKAKAVAKAKGKPKATAKAAKGQTSPKVAKPKAEGSKKDALGFRDGSAKSQAVAMYSAKGGATLEEVKAKVGSVQLNVLHALEADGHEVKRVKEEREGKRPATRYFLKLKK